MTDTPLIRAARALMKRRSGVDDFERLDEEMQAELLGDARAVLEAVWEPSDAQISAAQDTVTINHPADVWPAMIDAALAE
jgi:hypothetical protein